MKHYLYRCTTDKLVEHTDRIEAAGDVIVSSTYTGDRWWALLCRSGERTVADLTATELRAVISSGVMDALRVHNARPQVVGRQVAGAGRVNR